MAPRPGFEPGTCGLTVVNFALVIINNQLLTTFAKFYSQCHTVPVNDTYINFMAQLRHILLVLIIFQSIWLKPPAFAGDFNS